ncbi:fukutin-related protein-like protein [Leptotrombidium deliense]|uniref:Fukutin-related protein-like protein n=1 Tax=Leptotrombidium deliense TaxID=299467 RepID=A0A443S4I1_9ACAR|nr:fukutin-related protein-like protein [Leptotrombidium deliense]
MAFRSFGHLLRYGDAPIKRAVPLALALISISNPKLNILETLSKFSHDSDTEVACNAIFAMGLIGAGTNNARLSTMLRQLAQFHNKEANALFMTRIAQGLTHLGKGTLTLSPFHSDRQLMVPTAVAGLLIVLISMLDIKSTVLSKSHYLLYYLTSAIQPRMLVTFNEDLQPLPVPVRVGQAVDVVGQAGKPKTITGFQTHTTPVLLALGERAELATEEYIALTPILEALEKECITNDPKFHDIAKLEENGFDSLLSVIIVEFEEFDNKLVETINNVCERLPKAHIFVISENVIYPPIKLENTPCNVKFVITATNPLKSLQDTRVDYLIRTEFILILGDCTILPEEHPLSILKYNKIPDNSIIAIPVVSDAIEDFYSCYSLQVNVKEWTLDYSESNDQSECHALVGNFGFFTRTSTLMQLNSPFLRPLQESLFIQSKLRNVSIRVEDDTRFLRMNCAPVDEHAKWKINMLRSKRLKALYAKLGIKKVIKSNGEFEWYGCTKNSLRCFPTVLNDMPNYLFEGKWTPPCCLEHLRTTAIYVFQILEKSNVRYWLEGGSLLGAARNGNIIPWDYDVDIGIYEEDIEKCFFLRQSVYGAVKDAEGFVWEKATEGDFFRVQFSHSNHLHVDIFPFFSRNGTMTKKTWFANHPQDMEFPETYLKPLSKLQFVGWNANVPNNHIKFLEMKFGAGVIDNPQYPVPSMLEFNYK